MSKPFWVNVYARGGNKLRISEMAQYPSRFQASRGQVAVPAYRIKVTPKPVKRYGFNCQGQVRETLGPPVEPWYVKHGFSGPVELTAYEFQDMLNDAADKVRSHSLPTGDDTPVRVGSEHFAKAIKKAVKKAKRKARKSIKRAIRKHKV